MARCALPRAPLAAASLLGLAGCRVFGVVAVVDTEAPPASRDAGIEAPARPDAAQPSTEPVTLLDECAPGNPAGITASAAQRLLDAPTDPAQRILYPYAGTVFPGGVSAPLVMWEGPSSDAVLLRLRSRRFEYRGCLLPGAAGQLAIPQRAWDAAAAASSGADDPLELRITTQSGERAGGPPAQSLVIAPGRLPVALYFMRYGATGSASIWRLRPREAAQPLFSATDCSGCHTLAANGARLLGYSRGTGSAYRLSAEVSIDPEPLAPRYMSAENAALSPDGSLYFGGARLPGLGPRSMGTYSSTSGLFDVATGSAVPSTNLPTGATVPAFSPDGEQLVFNEGGHALASVDFDSTSRTASGHRVLYRDDALYPAWPSFLPDARRIVFAGGVTPDFSAGGARLGTRTDPGPESDLYLLDVATGQAQVLWQAMGFARADADSYLPFGAQELHQSYYPSVAPVTSGGYAWVFFDSIRHHGNQGSARQLWGAAIDLTSDAPDPSHPAFYVMGQELATTNLRVAATVEPAP